FVFFFQAEDGIRDRTVTGVQTCALPISKAHVSLNREALEMLLRQLDERYVEGAAAEIVDQDGPLFVRQDMIGNKFGMAARRLERSEERRVGKEWRSRWAAEAERRRRGDG